MAKSNEPRTLREIQEIREQIFEDTKNLSPEERAQRRYKTGMEIVEKYE